MRLVGVRSDLTPKAWPMIERWVAAALQRSKAPQTAADVRRALAGATMQLWLPWVGKRPKGAVITELFDGALGRTCGIVVVAGLDFAQWQPLTATLKAWALDQGCVRMEAEGRDGWKRMAKDDGWKQVRTVIEMEL